MKKHFIILNNSLSFPILDYLFSLGGVIAIIPLFILKEKTGICIYCSIISLMFFFTSYIFKKNAQKEKEISRHDGFVIIERIWKIWAYTLLILMVSSPFIKIRG